MFDGVCFVLFKCYCNLNAIVLYRVHQSVFTVGPFIKELLAPKAQEPLHAARLTTGSGGHKAQVMLGAGPSPFPLNTLSGCTGLHPDGVKLAE